MKNLKRIQQMLLVLCLGLLIAFAGRSACPAKAAETSPAPEPTEAVTTPSPEPTPEPVKVKEIDYKDLWLVATPGDNGEVYYSDKSKKVWSTALKDDKGDYYIDISWLKAISNGEINLKGDVNESIVTVTLPARESKYKIKFNKADGTLQFSNTPSGAVSFEWRKATSYTWSEAVPITDAQNEDSAFVKELSKLRISGASIYVRIVGENGAQKEDGTLNVGKRPGKEIKINVAKYANAPKIKVNPSKLTLNTTTAMEYSVTGGEDDETNQWKDTGKALKLEEAAPEVLASEPKPKTIWIRKKETYRAAHSKVCVLTIPAQRPAPAEQEVSGEMGPDGKYYLNFMQASKQTPYEYAVVKPGSVKLSWKSVVAPKKIALSTKTAPPGSIIHIRKKAINQTSKTDLELASKEMTITVPTPTPVPAGSTGQN